MTLGQWVATWHAYDGGPIISTRPWPVGWEQDPAVHDGHPHEWEHIIWANVHTLRPDGGYDQVERLRRCRVCHAPGCAHTDDRPPCREARHHRGPHHYGTHFEPVGGPAYAPRQAEGGQ